ncbi:hypothetical protein SDC9_108313 [bioreactor metagenome]|uniref:Uncharacterized protein n=1 Tax=bioreactor metagenome TaxID=1076179 RepID=A0A645B7Q8_9ZZZZ
MSGSRITGNLTVPGFYNPLKTTLVQFSPAGFEQCSHDGADHIAQESVGGDGKSKTGGIFLFPVSFAYTAVVGLHIAMQPAEAGKVFVSFQHLTQGIHGVYIGLEKHPVSKIVQKRVLFRREVIFIRPGYG